MNASQILVTIMGLVVTGLTSMNVIALPVLKESRVRKVTTFSFW